MRSMITAILTLLITQTLLQAEYLENATPPAKEYDWMELQSGEWLKGEFKGMYSGEVEFDSDEFDVVTFDLGDVKQIITKGESVLSLNRPMPSLQALSTRLHKNDEQNLTENQDIENEVIGKIIYKDNTFMVLMENGSAKTLPTDNIASIAGGEPKESNYWTANVFLGVDTLSGNSNQLTVTAKAYAQRRTALTRFLFDYLGTYTDVKDPDTNETVQTANSNRVTSSFDMYQTAHFYWRLASLEYLRDPFQNIDGRYTLSVGVGYDIIYTPNTNWSITMGPGYQRTYFTDYNQSNPDALRYAETPLVFISSRFDTEITSDVDFILNYQAYFVNHNSGRYIHHAEASLETELIADLTVDFSVFWDRTSAPNAFADGTYPEENDYKTMLAIGYSY